jgi:hypothetical protein
MQATHQHPDSPRRSPLARYVIAATLARASDGGAVVAIVLTVSTSGGSGWLAGALGACITAPHLLGSFVARSLDTARDGRIPAARGLVRTSADQTPSGRPRGTALHRRADPDDGPGAAPRKFRR